MITPLQWPTQQPRTPPRSRKDSRFGKRTLGSLRPLTIADAVAELQHDLRRFCGKSNADQISTNLRTRMDGWPVSNQAQPTDPGVAVYFEKDGANACIACDTYKRVADNMYGIARTLSALRQIERDGGPTLISKAFTGFIPLPAPDEGLPKEVRDALDFINSHTLVVELDQAWRRLRSKFHPDKGGDAKHFDLLCKAVEKRTAAIADGWLK